MFRVLEIFKSFLAVITLNKLRKNMLITTCFTRDLCI